MSRYLTSSLNTDSPVKLSSSFIGDLLLDTETKQLHTKNLENNIVMLGDSVRKLVEFPIYSYGDPSTKINNSFLRLYLDAVTNSIQIIDRISRIFINQLEGYTQTNVLLDSWLAFNQEQQLTNVPTNLFNLKDLVDVRVNENEDSTNYVLTFRSSGSYNTGDYFTDKTRNWGYWELRPETSQIKAFDDVSYGTEQDYLVFRGIQPKENTSRKLATTPLPISYDNLPQLSNSLNGDGYGLYNIDALTHVYINTDSLPNYSVNPSISNASVIHIDANYANTLNIYPLIKTRLTSAVFLVPVYISNFTGDINIPKSIYANGKLPVYDKRSSDRLLTLHINYTIARTVITVIQKSANVQ